MKKLTTQKGVDNLVKTTLFSNQTVDFTEFRTVVGREAENDFLRGGHRHREIKDGVRETRRVFRQFGDGAAVGQKNDISCLRHVGFACKPKGFRQIANTCHHM